MKHGRIVYNGAIHAVTPCSNDASNDWVCLADGRMLSDSEFEWLPPVEVGTVFALGLNYADHAKELAFKAPEVPLVFLKGPNSIIGNRARTRRPSSSGTGSTGSSLYFTCRSSPKRDGRTLQ